MRIISISILLIVSFSIGSAMGQQVINYKELNVGDTMPNYQFKTLINFKSGSASMADFKGKLVFLDFWATWCTWCISSIPKMQELQSKYSGKIQVVMVNQGESRKKVQDFFARREKLLGSKMNLPVLYGDTVLTNVIFKGDGSLPRIVWIDTKGVIKHIGNGLDVSAKNIEALLNEEEILLHHKKRSISNSLTDSVHQFFFIKAANREPLKDVMWRSTLFHELKGFPRSSAQFFRTYNNGLSFIAISNSSMIDLYRFAYGNLYLHDNKEKNYLTSIPTNRTILECDKKDSYGITSDNLKPASNLYSYQLIAPLNTSAEKLQKIMQSDLERYFGFTACRQNRSITCLVITSRDTSQITYKKGEFQLKYDDTKLILNNLPISYFIKTVELNVPRFGRHFLPPYPIIDETGVKGKIGNIDIRANIGDYRSLNNALSQYGLILNLEDREIDVLVISEPDL